MWSLASRQCGSRVTLAALSVAALALAMLAVPASAGHEARPGPPKVGRWRGALRDGPRVFFTVETTAAGQRYMVRPLVYCNAHSTTSWQGFGHPDAWPIEPTGLLPTDQWWPSHLGGRVGEATATLLLRSGTCAGPARTFVAHWQPSTALVADGTWKGRIAPHDVGIVPEQLSLRTFNEGTLLDATIVAYGNPKCEFFRIGMEILVDPDGTFDYTEPHGEFRTMRKVSLHLTGTFDSPTDLRGAYAITGPSCTGTPIRFNAHLTRPFYRPVVVTPTNYTSRIRLYRVAPPQRVVDYVALGDSYSSGHGVPPYDVGTDVRTGPAEDICHRSHSAYSRLVDLAGFTLERNFFACSGAVTDNVTDVVQYPGEHRVQLAHRAELRRAGLVTISIGGNDVRFDQVLTLCSRAGGSCAKPDERNAILDRAGAVEPKLVATYRAIRRAAPNAAVLVLDYPRPFPANGVPATCQPDAALFDPDAQRFIREAAEKLRSTIQDAAREAGVQFVDVIPKFDGHEICGPQGGWLIHVAPARALPPIAEEAVHPTREGQAAYASAIVDYLESRIAAGAPLTPAGLPANPLPS
jgi:lysophospholipase L1-like esterase